jgi:hypothetical protein
MKSAVSKKTRLLLLLILNIVGVIAAITFFVISSETDRFKIFMRGVMLFIFLGFSVSYCFDYIKELRKRVNE